MSRRTVPAMRADIISRWIIAAIFGVTAFLVPREDSLGITVLLAAAAASMVCSAFAAHYLGRQQLHRARQAVWIGIALYAVGVAVAIAMPAPEFLPAWRWAVLWMALPITLVIMAQYVSPLAQLRRHGQGHP